MTSRTYRRALGGSFVIMVLPLAWTVVGVAQGGGVEPSLAEVPAPSRCVEDRATMRFGHMKLLRERRDRAVREGRRAPSEPGMLEECIACHGAPASFCDRCHESAGVNLDCFGCHAR